MPHITIDTRLCAARMQPGGVPPRPHDTKSPFVISVASAASMSSSDCSVNRFSMLSDECLGSLKLSLLSRKSCKRASYRSHMLSVMCSAFKISASSVPPRIPNLNSALGSEEPLTLPAIVNLDHPATLLIDSGASSHFIDLDYATKLKLPLELKIKPKSLILADGKPSPIGMITHTCILKLQID